MPALSTQGSTLTFGTVTFTVTSVSVDAPQPEIVNMTDPGDPAQTMKMVYTGDFTSPGRVSVEAIGAIDPTGLIGRNENMTFGFAGGTIQRRAICDSATVDARVGDIFRLRMTFTPTNYAGE